MSLYFNYKVDVFPNNAIHVNASLHCQHKVLAVASHSEDKGGTVTVCNDEVNLSSFHFDREPAFGSHNLTQNCSYSEKIIFFTGLSFITSCRT